MCTIKIADTLDISELSRKFNCEKTIRELINKGAVLINMESMNIKFSTSENKVKYSSLDLESLNNCKLEDSDIYINTNNLCHNLSAVFSAVNFNKRGKHSIKQILNFDHHQDFGLTEDSNVAFHTWGKCVNSESYKKYVTNKENKFVYQVIGVNKGELKPIEISDPTDLYITIDRDVYINSYTSYGDGLYTFSDIYAYIKEMLEKNKEKVNLCGIDITGAPDPEKGKSIDGNKCFCNINNDISECLEIFNIYSKKR